MTPRRFPPRPRPRERRPLPVGAAYFDAATDTWISLPAWTLDPQENRR